MRLLVDQGAGSEGQALEDIAEDVWARGGSAAFVQLLPINEWRARPPNPATRVVAELCRERLVGQILTTNWDVLIERALEEIGQPYSKVVDAQSLAVEPVGTVTLIKLNGCIERPEFLKATRTDIEAPDWLDAWIHAILEVLVRTSSLLFAGYSGASRAATTTIARIVTAEERNATDFIVDRNTPDEIGAASESGATFVAATTLEPFTGDASDFFLALREALFPLLVARPARRAEDMIAEVVAPTQVAHQELAAELQVIVDAVKASGAGACQEWLSVSFSTFPESEDTKPYLPLLPNATEIGKCLLLLAFASWATHLDLSTTLAPSVAVTVGDVETSVPCHLVVCPPTQRLDAATRAAILRHERELPFSGTGVGIAFGGLGDVAPATTSFSVARGSHPRNAARGGGATVGWINADALFDAFSTDADADSAKSRIRDLFEEATARALEATT